MTLGRLANEAPLTPEEIEAKERKRRQIFAMLMAKKDKLSTNKV